MSSSTPPASVRTSHLQLTPGPAACTDARHWTTATLEQLQVASVDLRDDVELVVSELVSNAVQYGLPPFAVEVQQVGSDLLVSVSDAGRPPYSFGSRPAAPPTASHGRGLAIVAALAESWGIRAARPGPGKDVWCRLRPAVTGPER